LLAVHGELERSGILIGTEVARRFPGRGGIHRGRRADRPPAY
jgi:hypothetical protein